MIRLLADDAAISALTELPSDQRDAVAAHVIAGESYEELALAHRHLGGRSPPARLARARHPAPQDGRERMSDFVTELRREVVGAHAPHRVSAVRTRRRRRRPILAGAVALAALLVAVVLDRALDPAARADHEAARGEGARIGGDPIDGVLRRGSLWVADFGAHRVVRIDPARRKVIARIPIGNAPENLAADNESVWANTTTTEGTSILWRIDSATNRVADHINAGYAIGLAATPGRVWLARREDQHSIDVFSSAGGRRIGRIPVEGVTGHRDRSAARSGSRARMAR